MLLEGYFLKTVLILGKTGKLGRALARVWRAAPPAGFRPHWVGRGDLDAPLPEASAVIALWGVTSGDEAQLAQNTALAEAAVMIARATGAARVLHLSSAAVYGAGAAGFAEADPLRPLGAYGQAKADMEARISRLGGPVGNCVVRLANVAGCDSLFRALAGDAPLQIDRFDTGGGPLRSYIALPELAQVFEALIALPLEALPAVLNVAQPKALDMAEIAMAAEREIAWAVPRAGAVARVELDLTALGQIISLPEARAADMVAAWRDYGGWS
ncbi:NAD-dependent epimerase/dehydratase family protein [Lentibacter sp.]|uniref:NAD-dependent epimerase/dehydratase family protein n=1 Tax=Lentibacter sp. TaxID=2024994 RepID=UPI003F6963EF